MNKTIAMPILANFDTSNLNVIQKIEFNRRTRLLEATLRKNAALEVRIKRLEGNGAKPRTKKTMLQAQIEVLEAEKIELQAQLDDMCSDAQEEAGFIKQTVDYLEACLGQTFGQFDYDTVTSILYETPLPDFNDIDL
jgi:BMFP domain-containing protein YqiC